MTTALSATTEAAPAAPARLRWASLRFPLLVFAGVAVVLFAVANLSFAFLPTAVIHPHGFPDYTGFNAWPRWDSDWYLHIAREGYFYAGPGQQSAVAFFPGYPAAVRAVMQVVGNDIVAGVIVTYLAGAATVVLFHRWCLGAFGPRAARLGVLVLVLYPFAYYLFGAVYSDALFLAAVLGAFVLLESGHPWMAGLAGSVAVATRPVGLAVVVALALRALEIRGVLEGGPARFFPGRGTGAGAAPAQGHKTPLFPRAIRLRRLNWRDAGVGLSILGLVAFCVLLWHDFGDPFVFNKVYSAQGWNRSWDAHTVLKVNFFRFMRDSPWVSYVHIYLAAAAVFTVAGLALVPVVWRRLGWGYAAYTGIVLAMPAATSAEFLGMGRYVLAAFPCFAVVAAALAGTQRETDRPGPGLRTRIAAGWLALSATGLAFMMSLYARWYLIS